MQTTMRSMLLWGTIVITSAVTFAQQTPASRNPASGSLELAITYNASVSNQNGGKHFWMQGGGAQLHGPFYRGLGVVADVAGAHTGDMNASGVGLDLVTATFGPRYTRQLAHSRYALYGQVLLGEAWGFNSVFPAPDNATTTSNNLALKLGGGVNVALNSRRIVWRALEANWLYTKLPNSTTNAEGNLQLGTGFVVRFQ